jgi:hypothetical protein
MQEKHESAGEDDLFFCLVDFEPDSPLVYVLPSQVVAETVKTDHSIWMATPGSLGQPHKTTKIRRLKPGSQGQEPGWLDQYLERWDLIAAVD